MDKPFLRPLAPADVPTLASWGLDRRFVEHAGWTVGLSLSGHESRWRRLITEPKQDHLRLGAVLGADLVGYVDFAGGAPDRRELGYVVGPSTRWGRGLGGAIARLGLDHGFGVIGLREIWAEALDANHASVRILASLGMWETSKGEEELYLGTPTFYRRFAITSDEFNAMTEAQVG